MLHRIKPTQVLKLALLLGLVFGAYGVIRAFELERLLNPEFLVESLNGLGSLGPIVFIVIMATAVVVSPIPSLPLDIAAGIAFGPFLGTVYAVAGAEIGALVSFLIGRALGREVISRLLGIKVKFCEKCSDHHLMVLVFLARLLPIFSFDLVSYGAGLTNMSIKVFAIATLVGMIPPTFALTYLGSSAVTVEWPMILTGLLLAGLFLYLPKLILKNRSARWARLIQGEMPEPPVRSTPEVSPEASGETCPFCQQERISRG